jgi:hypothetical protein
VALIIGGWGRVDRRDHESLVWVADRAKNPLILRHFLGNPREYPGILGNSRESWGILRIHRESAG